MTKPEGEHAFPGWFGARHGRRCLGMPGSTGKTGWQGTLGGSSLDFVRRVMALFRERNGAMASIYYIDGYNVIHHSARLRPLAMENFELAREALIEHVGRFCVATGSVVKIIFDGRGRRAEAGPPVRGVSGLEVLYSPGHQSADALIERTVYHLPNRRNVIVVSADRGIRDLCRGLSALVMDPDTFLETIRETESDTRATLDHLKRSDTLNRIENRLDEGNMSALMRIKKQLES